MLAPKVLLQDAATIGLIVLTRPFYCLVSMLPRIARLRSEIFRNKNPPTISPNHRQGPHRHGIAAQYPPGGRRPRNAGADREISAYQRLQRDHGDRRS